MTSSLTKSRISRRDFLKSSSVGGAALIIGFTLPWNPARGQGEKKVVNPLNAWVRIDGSGKVTLITARSEMGQGIRTSLPMILAEELDVDWGSVSVEQAATNAEWYGDQGTGGSGSVTGSWMPLRQAGAAARQMVVAAAAVRWRVAADSCTTENGLVFHKLSGRKAGYGDLADAASKLPVPDLQKVTLKDPANFKIVGKSIPRTDVPAKVDGSAIFGLDVRVPGMLYAVIARCPTFGGKVARFNADKAKALPGVRHVAEIQPVGPGAFTAGGIAVVADSTWRAIKGREALDIEWDLGPHAKESSAGITEQFAALTSKPSKAVRSDGDAVKAIEGAARKIEAVYELPFQAHASMEPMNCTVDIRADRAEAWIPTQAPQWAQSTIAQVAGLKPEAVTVHTTFMGGGFGRRYQADFIMEAAQVAKAAGAPVMLVWTREDDMQHDFYRPAAYHKMSAALDDKGSVVAWLDRMASTSIRAYWDPSGRSSPEAQELDGAVNVPYAIPNVRMEYANPPSGVPVAWWRSVEHSINAFAVESFLDEIAAAARVDPLELRMRLLAEPKKIKIPADSDSTLDTVRLRNVLRLAAQKAGWGTPLPKGRGRGCACHFSFDTYIAHVAEVSVSKSGSVRVHRVVAAVDCGQVINPDGVRAQAESAIVYGLSAALKGAITIENGAVQQSNFHEFEVLRIGEMPRVEVHFIPSTERPTGMGEPSVPPIAPAVANAIFAATGKRVRRLPIRPEDLASKS